MRRVLLLLFALGCSPLRADNSPAVAPKTAGDRAASATKEEVTKPVAAEATREEKELGVRKVQSFGVWRVREGVAVSKEAEAMMGAGYSDRFGFATQTLEVAGAKWTLGIKQAGTMIEGGTRKVNAGYINERTETLPDYKAPVVVYLQGPKALAPGTAVQVQYAGERTWRVFDTTVRADGTISLDRFPGFSGEVLWLKFGETKLRLMLKDMEAVKEYLEAVAWPPEPKPTEPPAPTPPPR